MGSLSDKPRRRDLVVCRKMGDETVLHDSETGAIHALNPNAYLVWDLCDGEHGLADMEKALRDHFSISETDKVSEDIRDVIERFSREGLLEDA